MKQAEFDKLVNDLERAAAKGHGWQFSRGYVSRATDRHFFMILVHGLAKTRRLSATLRYKWLAFDDLFWEIVLVPENRKQPLSFRAWGAWTAPSIEVVEEAWTLPDLDKSTLHARVQVILERYDAESRDLENEVRDLDDNLGLIERLYAQHFEKHPGSLLKIWPERLLTHILKKEFAAAESLAQSRIAEKDNGGFNVGSQSFYQLALDYLGRVQ